MLEFKLLTPKDNIPYDLLLLADETTDAINKYLPKSDIYIGCINKQIVGVFCLYKVDSTTIEIKNIAIYRDKQSQGLGKKFIEFIKDLTKNKYSLLIVGTADIGFRQIKFYQENGFEKYAIKKNFFIENYPEAIYENTVQLKDMVMLKYTL